jgi:hypothetical protein
MSIDIEITPLKREKRKIIQKVINIFMFLIEKGELEYGDVALQRRRTYRKLNVAVNFA